MKRSEGLKGSRTTTLDSGLNTETHTEPLIRKPSEENESVLNKQTLRKKKTQLKRKSEASSGVSERPRDHHVDNMKVGNSGMKNQNIPQHSIKRKVQTNPVPFFFQPFNSINQIFTKLSPFPAVKPKVTRVGLPLVSPGHQSSYLVQPFFHTNLYPTFGLPVHPLVSIRPYFGFFPQQRFKHFRSGI